MADTFESRVAQATALAKGGTAPKAAAVPVTDEGVDDDSSAVDVDDSADEGVEASAAVVETPTVDAVKALECLKTGDLKAMVKALGGDESLLDTSDRKFAALRQQHRRVEKTKAEHEKAHKHAIAELTRISQQQLQERRELDREYSFVKVGRQAVNEKNWPAVAKSLVAFTGLDLATLTQKLATGSVGLSADDKALATEREKLAAERREFEAKKKNETDGKTKIEQRAAWVSTKVKPEIQNHPFIQVSKGFEKRAAARLERVAEAVEKSWDGTRFTKTAKVVADEMQNELLEEARAAGLPVTKPKSGKPRTVLPVEPPATKVGGKRSQSDIDADFARRVAAASRVVSLNKRH